MKIFVQTTKSGPFFTLFWSKIWPFSLKNHVFGHFLRNRSSDLSKTCSETGDNCFESSNGSVVSGKILDLAVLAIFGSKAHCMRWHLYGFGLFLAIFFQTIRWFLVNFCYLNYVYGLGMINEKALCFWSLGNAVES